MTPASGGAELSRLAEVIARQRRELDRVRQAAAARSVVDLARGVLMERLGCAAVQATEQLAHLAAEAGAPLTEMAAELIGRDAPVTEPATAPGTGPGTAPGTGPGTAPVTGAVMAQEPGDGSPASLAREAGEDHRAWTLAAAAVDSADDGTELAAALLEHALAPAGAVAAALWLLEPDGCLELAGEAGFGPLAASRWRRIPPDMECLPQRVVQQGRDFWWNAGRPDIDATPLIGRWPHGARTVLALREPRAAIIGVMEVCWPEPMPDFPDPLLRQLTSLAEVCANVLGTRLADGTLSGDGRMTWLFGLLSGLVDEVLIASAMRDGDGRVTDFHISYVSEGFRDPAGRSARDLAGRTLLDAYPATVRSDGLFDRAAQALATGVPQRLTVGVTHADADRTASVDVRVAKLFDGVVIAWRPTDEADRLGSLLAHAERLGRIGGWEESVVTGEVVWTDSAFALFDLPSGPGTAIPLAALNRYVVTDDHPVLRGFRETLLRGEGATAATLRVVRPGDASLRQLRIFGEPVVSSAGTVVALRGAFQDISAQYHAELALVASEQRADEEHRLALRLQQAIMPATVQPVEATGIDVAVRYRPAAEERLVGGDWYDTVVLPGKEVLLVVGDIAGHGIDAATRMVAMRNCLRGLAITGAGPAQLLGWLNSVACHLTADTTATVVCGRYNPVARILRWARAGHLPPVLVRDGAASALPLPQGVLLGVDPDGHYAEATTKLQLGDTLLMFTDGLIERRGVPIDEAINSLVRTASQPVASAAAYADRVLAGAASDTSDDACLVAVHIN